MAGNPSANGLIPATDAGTYPTGTLFEADVFYALRLPPRTTSSASASASASVSVNADTPTIHASSSSSATNANTLSLPNTIPQVAVRPDQRRARPPPKKRFKPTLNCYQCVHRKTKCDRARPSCRACLSRAQSCTYNELAQLIHTHHPPGHKRRRLKSLEREFGDHDFSNEDHAVVDGDIAAALAGSDQAETDAERQTIRAVLSPAPDLPRDDEDDSTIDFSEPLLAADTVITTNTGSQDAAVSRSSLTHGRDRDQGITTAAQPQHGSEDVTSTRHWLYSGNMEDVHQTMLQIRGRANHLLEIYLNTVDPVHPILDTSDLTETHHAFWSAPIEGGTEQDLVKLALLQAVYACAAQQSSHVADRLLVETCLSACHQTLCKSQYLRWHSLQRCQAVFLICQCLINDSREHEAWTLAGLNQRQAIGLGLDVAHNQTSGHDRDEQWQRIQLWAALVHQDNLLSSILKVSRSISGPVSHIGEVVSTIETEEPQPQDSVPSQAVCDHEYLMALVRIANVGQILQTNMDLSQLSSADKSQALPKLQEILSSLGPPFQNLGSFWTEQQTTSRIARQGIEIMCVAHFYMTRLTATTNEPSSTDDESTCHHHHHQIIDCVHDGLSAFFSLADLPANTRGGAWSSCHTLCYLQTLTIGELLGSASRDATISSSSSKAKRRDPMLILAKSDFDRFLERLVRMGDEDGTDSAVLERIRKLRQLRTDIRVV